MTLFWSKALDLRGRHAHGKTHPKAADFPVSKVFADRNPTNIVKEIMPSEMEIARPEAISGTYTYISDCPYSKSGANKL